MRVFHLNCGTMRPLGGKLVDGRSGLFERARVVCHCLLIETGDGLVLIETGIGSQGATASNDWLGAGFSTMMRPSPDVAESAAHQVVRLGFAVEDVRHIVLTHLDLDHAGGLVDFPHATVHVYQRELDSLHHPGTTVEKARYRSVQFAHSPQWSSYGEPGEPWFGFQAVRELRGLPSEILLIPLAGHTFGHAGIAVDTGSGWLLHAGDSYYHPDMLDDRNPRQPPIFRFFEKRVQMDGAARIDNQRRLRELANRHGDEISVFSAHDAGEFARFEDVVHTG